ncbi:hypothetical protein [Rhodospira trueperi]|uniref:Uncharacterized protein n=1 Tax=Rhodospira trueperi TaxID=69960 RepID=A0A1G6XVC3_9PROT|nr:hypothetical protein [Rhodospira trueperi]SDD82119.1 hypothetical protein SAMN05421720_101652 [Rhodospira trueperi]
MPVFVDSSPDKPTATDGVTAERTGGLRALQFNGGVTADDLRDAVKDLELNHDLDLLDIVVAQGRMEARRDLTLPANALVDRASVVVTARSSALTAARAVAQLRLGPPPPGYEDLADGALIVDLGVPRTVTAIAVPESFGIHQVRTWTGTGFGPLPAFPSPLPDPLEESDYGSTIVLPAEVRTERLEITYSGGDDGQNLMDRAVLALPDAPANLQLAIEGSGIVWREQGIVTPGPDEEITTTGWNSEGKRRVDLTAALGARLGNPRSADPVTLVLVLTSSSPGALAISALESETRRIRRCTLAGQSGEVVSFSNAGRVVQALTGPDLPTDATVSEIRFTASASPRPPRTLPPVGPEASDKVALTLDPDHAVLVRLPVTSGLEHFEALSVAATGGPEGAEIRALLWDSRVDAEERVSESMISVPTAPLEAPATDPASLEAGAQAWAWLSLTFPEPVPLPPDRPLWAAILCSRGAATLAMTDTTAATEAGRVRVGPATGPFQALPALFDREGYAGLRARIRMIGTAPAEAPLDPLAIGWPAAATVLPTKKGTRVILSGAAVAGGPALDLVALTPMTLTLTDIDVVSDS